MIGRRNRNQRPVEAAKQQRFSTLLFLNPSDCEMRLKYLRVEAYKCSLDKFMKMSESLRNLSYIFCYRRINVHKRSVTIIDTFIKSVLLSVQMSI
jgi:hypothetical protein